MDEIADEALVIRGGRNRPEDIERGVGTHPSGVTGVSVECAAGLALEELAVNIPLAEQVEQLGLWMTSLDGAQQLELTYVQIMNGADLNCRIPNRALTQVPPATAQVS